MRDRGGKFGRNENRIAMQYHGGGAGKRGGRREHRSRRGLIQQPDIWSLEEEEKGSSQVQMHIYYFPSGQWLICKGQPILGNFWII